MAQQPKRPELTARELFYNSGSAAAAASPNTASATKKVEAKRKPVLPVTQTPVTQANTPAPSQPSPRPQPSAPQPAAQHDGAQIIPVAVGRTSAPAPASGTALGLKYTVMKLTGDGMKAVAPSSVFRAGDKIQFSVETNASGYLYIVSQGSSGIWKPMFPSPEIEGGNNGVEGFHTYTFPSGYRYVFDQQAGDERVFIIFSRDAKPDFEQLVYSLQGRKTAKPAAQPMNQPMNQPTAEPDKQTPVLRASIDESALGRLSQTYSRDLVIERVGDDAGAQSDNKEKAVYVVNASGSADAALVADLNLVHQ